MRQKWLTLVLLICAGSAFAQTVSPVIVQYKGKADGRFELTNNTLEPMAVILEPRSFTITPNGNGIYRPLDPDIHLKLSAMSFVIEPGQMHYVFYKATAKKLPAWFTIYSVFSALHPRRGINVRILLPHTVYIYPKRRLAKNEVKIQYAIYHPQAHELICDLVNSGPDLERVQIVRINWKGKSVTAAGFPLLPGGRRHLELKWKEKSPPRSISFRFLHTTLHEAVTATAQ